MTQAVSASWVNTHSIAGALAQSTLVNLTMCGTTVFAAIHEL